MVDENDFDLDELRLLGMNIEGGEDETDERAQSAAFERIFDDDIAAEETKAALIRHQKTAQMFAASAGFAPMNGVPKISGGHPQGYQ